MESNRHVHAGGRAFTLVEAVVSMVVVGVMFVAALTTVASAAQSRRVIVGWRRMDGLARALLVEVEQARYGSTAGSVAPLIVLGVGSDDRTVLTSMDDFNGFSETALSARDGTKLAGHTGWTRTVLVERVDPLDPMGASTRSTDKGMKRVTVTVRAPGGEQLAVAALRSRWSMADLDVTPGQTRAQAAVVRVRSSGGGPDLYSGTMMPNGPALGPGW